MSAEAMRLDTHKTNIFDFLRLLLVVGGATVFETKDSSINRKTAGIDGPTAGTAFSGRKLKPWMPINLTAVYASGRGFFITLT